MMNIGVVRDFWCLSRAFVSEIQGQYGSRNILRARREGVIPSRGVLAKSGAKFRFHGVGCEVREVSGRTVDFDLAQDGETILFDAWRLQQFASTDDTDEVLEAVLLECESRGALVRSGENPSPNMYMVYDLDSLA